MEQEAYQIEKKIVFFMKWSLFTAYGATAPFSEFHNNSKICLSEKQKGRRKLMGGGKHRT